MNLLLIFTDGQRPLRTMLNNKSLNVLVQQTSQLNQLFYPVPRIFEIVPSAVKEHGPGSILSP